MFMHQFFFCNRALTFLECCSGRSCSVQSRFFKRTENSHLWMVDAIQVFGFQLQCCSNPFTANCLILWTIVKPTMHISEVWIYWNNKNLYFLGSYYRHQSSLANKSAESHSGLWESHACLRLGCNKGSSGLLTASSKLVHLLIVLY